MEMNLNPLRRKKADDFEVPKTAALPRPRPDGVAKAIETGLAELAQLRLDRDDAVARMSAALDMCEKAKSHILHRDEEIARLRARIEDDAADTRSRVAIYQIERDQAIAQRAELDVLLKTMFALMRTFKIEETPIAAVASDAEAPKVAEARPVTDEESKEIRRRWQERINGNA